MPTTPRLKLTGVTGDEATLDMELIDAEGRPVLTLHRITLRVGNSFAMADLAINLHIDIKEQ